MIHLALILVLASVPEGAFACASCGSGGDEPLVLYPNEKTKSYLGYSQGSGFRNVNADGKIVASGGPERKEIITTSIGHSLSPRSFVTFGIPYVSNSRGSRRRSGAGDPLWSVRYTLVLPLLSQPLRPQVQLLAAFKHAQAPSIYDAQDEKYLLDVRGSGFREFRSGIDIWNGQRAFKYGLAHTVTHSESRSIAGKTYRPGLAQRTTVTVGYGWNESIKTLAGINREDRGPLKVDGQAMVAQRNHSVFFTQDVSIAAHHSLRLTLSRNAAVGHNYNTFAADYWTLAWMRSW
jgi:hypothetical protein